MHNLAAKYHARMGHNPSTELNFPSFWKEIDAAYFCQITSQEELSTTAQNLIQTELGKPSISCNVIRSPLQITLATKKPSSPRK
jgi:hypothetical protein